jgi:hypothetical protein
MSKGSVYWRITCSCGWERPASSAWTATEIAALHARHPADPAVEHILTIEEPPPDALAGPELPLILSVVPHSGGVGGSQAPAPNSGATTWSASPPNSSQQPRGDLPGVRSDTSGRERILTGLGQDLIGLASAGPTGRSMHGFLAPVPTLGPGTTVRPVSVLLLDGRGGPQAGAPGVLRTPPPGRPHVRSPLRPSCTLCAQPWA